ncbi:SprT-like domain-containing protein [Marivirga arenosa]|uniref:Transcription elongation protein SprT n=1 Tax=Marivirga arenosa TaxID=3059076 RepID=A0AA51ZVZ8_9BACT|nr:SprT-like domain-containing protein [Marivirga sp. BKB1-2]WNB17759.1 transcription elongation protein SprT [Marivirga sp. BKB1-2]
MTHYEKQIYKRISRFIPESATDLAFELWQQKPFRFVISKARNTKLGDFRIKPGEEAVITVNENLNPYSFLITYVHEVAHHWVYEQYKGRVSPHGVEWKLAFKELMLPFQNTTIFPEEVLKALNLYMRNPKAASLSDIHLAKALKNHDPINPDEVSLLDVEKGQKFKLENRVFEKLESRRTRVRCKEIKSGKYYLVHKMAMIIPVK